MCILGSILRTGCLAPYVRSVQGNWENKVLRSPVLLLPPASPSCVWRQEIWVRLQSEGHVAMVYTPLTSDLFTPPPHGLSHPLPWSSKQSPLGPSLKIADLALPSQHNGRCTLKFVWVTNEKQMISGTAWEQNEEEEDEAGEIFVQKNNPGTLSNYIYLSCVALLGRSCGHPCRIKVHFSTSHYLILMYKERMALDSIGGQW